MASFHTHLSGPSGPYCQVDALLRERFAARDLYLFARRAARSIQSGNVRTRFRGRGVDFEEVRLYQPGDDIRAIDWRVTARTQIPHTKVYSEERERPVYILCDQRAPMFFGSINTFKSVLACHVSAALGWAALAGGDRVGSVVFNDKDFLDSRPKRNKHAVLQLIQNLRTYNHALTSPLSPTTAGLSLTQMLKDTRRIAAPGAALFIISDFHDLDDSGEEQLFHLSRHLDITLIPTSDPIEHQLAGSGTLTVTDGQQRQAIPIGERDFQQAYQALNEQRQADFYARAQRLALEVLPISTADGHTELLRQRFGRKVKHKRR